MKILRVIASVNPEHGGPIEGLKRSSAMLTQWGHETEVVTFDDPTAAYLKNVPFPVHACGPGKGKFGYAPRLAPWVRENAARFDVAVLHGLWNYAPIGAWRGMRGQLPYVQFTHGMLDPWFNTVQPVKRWVKQALWTSVQGRVLHDAKVVLFTSEEERRLARTSFFGHSYKERVVAYGAADAPEASTTQTGAFTEKVPALNGRPYILYLSRIHAKKGCDLLVKAFAKVADKWPHINLVIAGPDQTGLRAELERIAAAQGIAGRIHWPGMLQGAAKWGAFKGAMAFILPSHQENFGIVVAEAMACDTPVLISDKVNIWREVEASGGGLVEPDTQNGTLSLLEKFLALSDEQRAAMGLKARLGYEAHFSIDGAAHDLLAILEEVSRT